MKKPVKVILVIAGLLLCSVIGGIAGIKIYDYITLEQLFNYAIENQPGPDFDIDKACAMWVDDETGENCYVFEDGSCVRASRTITNQNKFDSVSWMSYSNHNWYQYNYGELRSVGVWMPYHGTTRPYKGMQEAHFRDTKK